MTTIYGATPDEWTHFDLMLGLTDDLLPVVSNPNATISAKSKLKSLGKTPSIYNGRREVAGLSDWTDKHSTEKDVARWAKEPDYGICIQTRAVRAIDVDVPDSRQAQDIAAVIERHLGPLPIRMRRDSAKFLVALTMPGEYYKRIIRTSQGIVEFLATGQQFIAVGQHKDGERYEWAGGLPNTIPEVTPAKFELLWAELEKRFAIAPATEASAPSQKAKLSQVAENDPVAMRLFDLGMVLAQDKKTGKLDIQCPHAEGHSSVTADSSTSYYPANTGGYAQGHFHCLHASCAERTDQDFKDAIGLSVADQFDILPPEEEPAPNADTITDADIATASPTRFSFQTASTYAGAAPGKYIIKGVLPQAELVVIYGASGSGKTFAILDMVAAIAREEPWCGLRVHGGRVAYVVAEGAAFFRGRLQAYSQGHGVPLEDIDLHILGNAPNLLQKADVVELIGALKTLGPLSVVVIDTLAQTMPGGDENSGVDVGKLLSNCRAMHRATGATVILVHHSGKDETRGARGWSGLRAACDAELEVTRNDNLRALRVSKQKDGVDNVEYGFKLKTVQIGVDEDGDAIESCIVEHADAPRRVGGTQRSLKGPVEKLAYSTAMGMFSPGGGGLSVSALIDAVVAEMPFDAESGQRDQRRGRVLRAIDSLKTAGYFELDVNGDIVLKNSS